MMASELVATNSACKISPFPDQDLQYDKQQIVKGDCCYIYNPAGDLAFLA